MDVEESIQRYTDTAVELGMALQGSLANCAGGT